MAHILVVEDERQWREHWETVAELLNVQVTCASTLSEAEGLLAARDWDAVITDLMYPQHPGGRLYPSGLDIVARLRWMSPDTPFLLYSGSEEDEVAKHCAAKGITLAEGEFVRKDTRLHITASRSLEALLARIPARIP